MSIFINRKKIYLKTLKKSQLLFDFSYCNKIPFNTLLSNGYNHTLYFPLNEAQYSQALNLKNISKNRIFKMYSSYDSLNFIFYDGLTSDINTNVVTYITYKFDNKHKSTVYVYNTTNLFYTIDKNTRLYATNNLNYESFENKTLTAEGVWLYENRGIKLLGNHFTDKNFEFPLNSYIQIKKEINKSSIGYDNYVSIDTNSLMSNNFIALMVFSENSIEWNDEFLSMFIKRNNISNEKNCIIHEIVTKKNIQICNKIA